MRYTVDSSIPDQYTIFDSWYHDPERKSIANTFRIATCHDIDVAEKVARALNQYDGQE